MSGLTLGRIRDREGTRALLRKAGMREPVAAEKADLFSRAAGALVEAGSDEGGAALGSWVPGRIEVLGKHTDYGAGRSIVTAVERGFCLVATPREDATIRMVAAATGERADFDLSPRLDPARGHWSNYPMTVARRLTRNFPECRGGADIAFLSDLPIAAGMSSSSAMIVGTFRILAARNRLPLLESYRRNVPDGLALASYLGTVENGQTFGDLAGDRGVGTFGGSEDHTAMICSEAGRLGQFAYCPARLERRIPAPEGTEFAVGVSGVVAEKTGAAQALYNRASGLVSAMVAAWREATGGDEVYLASILSRGPEAVERLRRILAGVSAGPFTGAELTRRLEHFLAENGEIVGPAGDALAAGDLDGFGRMVDRSQALTESLLGNQVPETVALARTARECGALAASAFGAGFGGSVWALVCADRTETFLARWSAAYRAAHPEPASRGGFFTTRAGPAAFDLSH